MLSLSALRMPQTRSRQVQRQHSSALLVLQLLCLQLAAVGALRPSEEADVDGASLGGARLAAEEESQLNISEVSSAELGANLTGDCHTAFAELHLQVQQQTLSLAVPVDTVGDSWATYSGLNVKAWQLLYTQLDFIARRGRSQVLRKLVAQVGAIRDVVSDLTSELTAAAAFKIDAFQNTLNQRQALETSARNIIDSYIASASKLEVVRNGGRVSGEERASTFGRLLEELQKLRPMLRPAVARFEDAKHIKCFSAAWQDTEAGIRAYKDYMKERVRSGITWKTVNHDLIGRGKFGTPMLYMQGLMQWIRERTIEVRAWVDVCDDCMNVDSRNFYPTSYKSKIEGAKNSIADIYKFDWDSFRAEPTELAG